MKRFLILCSLLVSVWGLSAQRSGGGGPGMNQKGSPCFEDHEKFCKDVDHRRGAMRDCLLKNEAQLSAGCKDHLNRTKDRPRRNR
ncbi:hypothetical protein [Leptospira yasudae]|uniref:hypothetical protein n=1 Tax=Leptospira yasudae TaxID=2202201 RepID=UPI001090BC30|nr:hypothetical protein [Leptospira yasudae]TGM99231.1 hypothetical protein EHR10_10140 [Leptospira yasudae]